MKRKVMALVLAGVLAVSVLAGCSGGKGEKESIASSSEQTQEQTVPDTAESTQESTEEAGSVTVTDHTGNVVTIDGEINRIVVTDVYPLASVLTVFLGSAEKIVGVAPTSMSAAKSGILGELYPEFLEADTGFVEDGNVNVESVLALEPDLVFYNAGNKELGESLTAAGMTAVGVSATKFGFDAIETYNQWVTLLAEIFPEKGESALAVTEYSRDIYDMIQERVSDIPEEERKEVLFLFQYSAENMITSGRNFFGQYWCEAIGAHNVAEEVEAQGTNAVINMEQVYEWNPDVIFITNFTPTQPSDLYGNTIGADDWSTVAAVQNENVYKMPLGTYRTYTPNTDTPLTLLYLAKQVYPDIFEDIDLTAEVKDYYSQMYGVELTDDQVAAMYNPSGAAAGN